MNINRTSTVLIVDDTEPNRIVLQDYLQTLGYETISAENGQQALELVNEEPPDAVLLDILMPVMDGFECLKRLKANEKTRSIPVIVISALDEMDSVVRCLEMGATDFLTKPFNSVLLRARLSASLHEKESLERERQLHSELEKSYEELQQTEHTRDALAHMIVHDLNNPLTAVMGRAQLFLMACNDGDRDWDDAIKNHRVILSAAEEMATLIRSILDISKMEGDQIEVKLEKFDIEQTAAQVCEQMQLQASQLGVELSLKNDTDGCSVLADRTLLHRVLQNLLANAFKHGGEDARVELCVAGNEHEVIISVTDDGPGIPTEYHDRVFDKYFQINKESPGKQYGVGLGLTFCHMAVEAQGGRIWVENNKPHGSKFSVSLSAA